MEDLISRQAVRLIESDSDAYPQGWNNDYEKGFTDALNKVIALPSAQPERILYANMSDAEFEKWLNEHGICNPNIHESIPCDAVPLLIDNAISELPSAQPEIIRCGECKNHIDERCIQADHHTSDNDCCMTVFHAERRTDE